MEDFINIRSVRDDLDEERAWLPVFARHLDEWNLDSSFHGAINIRDYPEEDVRRFLARGISERFANSVTFVRTPITDLMFDVELKLKELEKRTPAYLSVAENDLLAQFTNLIPSYLDSARKAKDYSVRRSFLNRLDTIAQMIEHVVLGKPALKRDAN